jgi:hypothetical protein
MRPDLAKCTTESPRSGGGYATKIRYGGRVQFNPDPEAEYLDEYGGFRSSSRYRNFHHKEFTDALAALRGNIRANVGRPWDKVYSEFCRYLDRRSVAGYHIWTHLMREVETKTFLTASGKVCYLSPYSGTQEVSGFYVHPRTGLLCHKDDRRWTSDWRYRKLKIEDVRIPVPGTRGWDYRQIDGLWFRAFERIEEVSLRPVAA